MSSIATEYYEKKFEDDRRTAFIHLIPGISFAMKKNIVKDAKMEIT